MTQARIVRPSEGRSYEWQNDTITVRLTARDTAGAYTLTEDRMKPAFALGLHLHREHAETFHVLEGEVEFTVGADVVVAGAGTTVHVPPGVPHAARVANGREARMLMLYAPAGFEDFLERMAGFTDAQFADEAFMRAFEAEFDSHAVR